MVIVVMITMVVMVVVAVVWIWGWSWGATVESDMAVRPVDVDVRAGLALFLCQLLCCCMIGTTLVRMMRGISPRQKRG